MSGDINDLSDMLPDLSWLDEKGIEITPHQNLDTKPELAYLWRTKDPKGLPRVQQQDHSEMLSKFHKDSYEAVPVEEIVQTARYLVMQTTNENRILESLRQHYDSTSLKQAKTALQGVLSEIGLLGQFYIDAEDFPGCATSSPDVVKFATRFLGRAKYVKRKPACDQCAFATDIQGVDHCAVFNKQLVLRVPYTQEVALEVEDEQKARGKEILPVKHLTHKSRIRAAMLAKKAKKGGIEQTKPIEQTQRLLEPVKPQPSVSLPEDLSPVKEVVEKKIKYALTHGSLSTIEAHKLYADLLVAKSKDEIEAIGDRVAKAKVKTVSVYQGVERDQTSERLLHVPSKKYARITSDTITRDRIILSMRKLMNNGLFGDRLLSELKMSFTTQEIQACRKDIALYLQEQGLQGKYFIDPTVYPDYGRGCQMAKGLFRSNPVPYIRSGPRCQGCQYQQEPGFCSQLNKRVVEQVPYPKDRSVLQQECLRKKRPMVQGPDGRADMEAYELAPQELNVVLDEDKPTAEYVVSIRGQKVKV